MHSSVLNRLSNLRLPSHVQSDELAHRFRNVKYTVRMSRSGFDLLVGWLTEGVGGEATGAGGGFSGERGKRGRAAVMRVVNNHLRFDGNYCQSFCVYYMCSQMISDIFQHDISILECLGRIHGPHVIVDTSARRLDNTTFQSSGV